MSAMKLTPKALEALDDNLVRLNVALALGFTDTWVRKLVAKNKPNSPLTTVAAINTIEKVTGLKQSDVLEVAGADQVAA